MRCPVLRGVHLGSKRCPDRGVPIIIIRCVYEGVLIKSYLDYILIQIKRCPDCISGVLVVK